MAFFKRQDIGRVYVVKLTLPDDTAVFKIGMCHSDRSTDRMMEILRSWFSYFRFVPYTELKLDIKCQNAKEIESYVHSIVESVAFEPNFKVQGSTEMFIDLDETRLVWFIRSLVNSNYASLPKLTKTDRQNVCELLKVNHVD